MKTLTENDVKIELIAEYDHIPVRGNAIDSGDSEYNKHVEDQIIDRLESGDVWAWASVEVRATYKGLTASTYLGACCYADEQDFINDGYYQDMVNEVVEDINNQITDLLSEVL